MWFALSTEFSSAPHATPSLSLQLLLLYSTHSHVNASRMCYFSPEELSPTVCAPGKTGSPGLPWNEQTKLPLHNVFTLIISQIKTTPRFVW